MRLLPALLSALLSLAAAAEARLVPRQFGNLGGIVGPGGGRSMRAAPVRTETLQPLLRKEANRTRLCPRMPLQMDPSSQQLNKALTGFCTNCTVLYGKAAIFYENGTKAGVLQGVYQHHIVVVDVAKRGMPFYLCSGQGGFLGSFPAVGFIVSGNDEAANWYTTPDGAFDSGYVLGARAQLMMQAELVNYLPVEQRIYIAMEYEWLPGTTAARDASVSLFSVTGCDMPDYHAPKDQPKYNVSSARVPIPQDGYIINAKGHLHDGGVNVELRLNDKVVYGPSCAGGEAVGGYYGDGTVHEAGGGEEGGRATDDGVV
ncbi:hypothetical protein EJ06DRAFT_549235 [Trichodelitschia bisporula]|uniref:Uncharacterized protein n=1 Tax=Trichodelitschia bisporula TaxID=703511 RepID=A0A6G1HUS6_9PEZI|nr:hypothetical protein EJ06DRAFT_549235 [Trichodelitschia bisporula]